MSTDQARGLDHGEGFGRITRTGIARCGLCGGSLRLSHIDRKARRATLIFHGWRFDRRIGWHHHGGCPETRRR